MRYLIVLLLLMLPVTAGAQQHKRPRPQPPSERPRVPPAERPRVPHAEKPKVPAQFSAVIPTPWPDASRWRDIAGTSRSSRRDWSQHRQRPYPGRRPIFGGGYYALPYSDYYPGTDAGGAAPYEPSAEPEATTGELRLEITPATGLQYYIDGMFIGSSSDMGTQFRVNAGSRRIEIRASGYKPVIFDARFSPGETITRRGALERVQDVAALPRPTGSRTMYVIPGCFMGNARPEPATLPKGCDINRMVTRGGL